MMHKHKVVLYLLMDLIFSGIEKLGFVNTVMSKAFKLFFFLVSMLGDKVRNIVQALFLDNLLFLFYYEGQMHGLEGVCLTIFSMS